MDNLTGTAGNDTFIGDSAVISAADFLNGGSGTDTAQLYMDAADESLNASSIEIFKVQATAAGDAFDMANVTGATEVWSNGTTAGDITFANVANVVKVGVIGGDGGAGDNVLVQFKAGVATGAISVEVQGADIDELGVGSADGAQEFSTINIAATTANSEINQLVDGTTAGNTVAAALRTVNITGDKRLTVAEELTNVTTVDASASTGGARVILDDTSAIAVTFKGSAAADRVDIQDNGDLGATDSIDGGAGTDTLRLSDDVGVDVVASAAVIKNFEVLEYRATAATAFSVDVDNLITNNTLAGVTFSGGDAGAGDNLTVNNINSGALNNIKVTLTDEGDNVVLTAKDFVSGGTSETATIEFNNNNGAGGSNDADGIDVATLNFANVDVLNIKSVSDGTVDASGAEGAAITDLDAGDLEKIVVTGDEAMTITLGTSGGVSEVDGSAMTNILTFDVNGSGNATSILVKGGTADDALTIDTDIAATVYTGGGSDVVTLEATTADTLIFTATALNAGDVLAGDALTVNGTDVGAIFNFSSTLEALLKVGGTVLSTAAANQDIDAAAFGATTNVDATVGAANIVFQIDLNGDGAYTAANDFQITFAGAVTAGAAGVQYNFANDYFELV